jgi:hypothetical protein
VSDHDRTESGCDRGREGRFVGFVGHFVHLVGYLVSGALRTYADLPRRLEPAGGLEAGWTVR